MKYRSIKNVMMGASLLATTGISILEIPVFLNPGRPLNDTEETFTRELFGDQLDYKQVVIHKGMKGVSFLSGLAIKSDACSVGNHIYFSDELITKDASDPEMFSVPLDILAHEATHTADAQKGFWSKTQLLGSCIYHTLKGDYETLYNAPVLPNQKYDDLNHEKRAMVMQDIANHMLTFNSDIDELTELDSVITSLELENPLPMKQKGLHSVLGYDPADKLYETGKIDENAYLAMSRKEGHITHFDYAVFTSEKLNKTLYWTTFVQNTYPQAISSFKDRINLLGDNFQLNAMDIKYLSEPKPQLSIITPTLRDNLKF